MKRSEVGKWGVNFRLGRELLLQEMAEAIQVSPSYLSSIEHGRKQPPEDWHDRVTRALNLSLPESASLLKATIRSRRQVSVPINNDFQARFMVAFESNKDSLSEEAVEKVEAILSGCKATRGSADDKKKKL